MKKINYANDLVCCMLTHLGQRSGNCHLKIDMFRFRSNFYATGCS